MPVQFLCPACSQPIEVDDQWAARPVACPYCRKTVTAPEVSTLDPASVAPQASPVGLSQPPHGLQETAGVTPAPATNRLAAWALGLASAAVVLYVGLNVVITPRVLELAGPTGSVQEAQRNLAELIEQGQAPSWLAAAAAATCLVFGFWVAGVVCGIVALRRPTGRGLAIASLAISGVLLLLFCAGGVMGVAGGAVGRTPTLASFRA